MRVGTLLLLILVGGAEMLLAHAEVSPTPSVSYNAFDLARGVVDFGSRPAGCAPPIYVQSQGLVQTCTLSATAVTKSVGCGLFKRRDSGALIVHFNDAPQCPGMDLALRFDGGVPHKEAAIVVDSKVTLPKLPQVPTEVAFFSTLENTWSLAQVVNNTVMIGPMDTGTLYAKMSTGAVVAVRVERPALAPLQCSELTDSTYTRIKDDYRICVDQARTGVPEIVAIGNTVIRPNVHGKIFVRHRSDVVVIPATTGSSVAITRASLESGKVDAFVVSAGVMTTSSTTDNISTTTVLVTPHAPGAFHIALMFADAADQTKTKGQIHIDLLVDQTYFGGLRVGLGKVFSADDSKFEAVTLPNATAATVQRREVGQIELVVGGTLYLDGFRNGRTYTLSYGSGLTALGNWLARHTGLYFGAGVLSFAADKVDLLRSLHLGLDVQINRNVSIGLSLAFRRGEQLDNGYMIGDPAPATGVPTRADYSQGYGLILNLNTEFFAFAAKPAGG